MRLVFTILSSILAYISILVTLTIIVSMLGTLGYYLSTEQVVWIWSEELECRAGWVLLCGAIANFLIEDHTKNELEHSKWGGRYE